MKIKASIQVRSVVGVILMFCGLQLYGQQTASGAEAEGKAATITTFDAPGAGTGQFQGTFPTAISPAGVIAGYYLDANNIPQGFLRAPRGATIPFDPKGSLVSLAPQGSKAFGINPAGAITGYYLDANFVDHGFLRIPAQQDE